MKIIPDVPPKIFTLSAIAVGYLLIDDTTANEQNALGNWLMLTAQVLCTNAFYKQVQSERKTDALNNEIYKNQNQSNHNENYKNSYRSQSFSSDAQSDDTIEMLKKMIDAIQKEINELKSR